MKNESNPYSAPTDAVLARNDTSSLRNTQIDRRGVILLTAAAVYWGWLLSELFREPVALAVFASVTLLAGVCGHLLYRYVLTWRGTVLFSLLLMPLPVLGLLGLLFGSIGVMLDLVTIPIEFLAHQTWIDRITFSLPVFLSIVILSIAHPLKPSLSNAIITSIGISLWYGLAILIAANAG